MLKLIRREMRTMNGLMNRWITILLAVLLPLGLGCDRSPPASAPTKPADRLLVVASVHPLATLARQVGGDRVTVHWWIESGQALAGYQPTPEQVEQMRRAAAILSNGQQEASATDEFSGAFGDRRVIRLDALAKHEFAESQLWLDTTLAAQAALALADRLAAMDAEGAQAFRDRATSAEAELRALSSFGAGVLSGLRGGAVCSIGKDYTALGREMGFKVLSISSDPAVSFDHERLSELPKILRQKQATLLLVEADTPPTVLTNLQQSVPVPVVVIDSLGSSSSQGRNTYDKIMRYNYEQLAAGLRKARGQ